MSKSFVPGLALVCALSLSACGGGGSSSSPSPAPSPAPAPAPAPPPSPPPPDTTAPETTLTGGPTALTNANSTTFIVTSTEAGTLEGSVDGGAFAAITSPWTLSGLADGAHTVSVRARDAANNFDASPATFAWTIDTVPPDTTIVSGPALDTASTSATFTFTSEAGATFVMYTSGGGFPVTSPWQLTALTSGTQQVRIQAVDAAGNADPTPAGYTWEVDSNGPVAHIVFPPLASYTDSNAITVRGTASDAHAITAVSVNGVPATTSDDYANWSAQIAVLSGNNNIVVSTTDSMGNTNASAATAVLANRGPVFYEVTSVVWDGARNRLLAVDNVQGGILAVRASDGIATHFSDASHGTGPALDDRRTLLLDAANNRALSIGFGTIRAVDLTTGNRTALPYNPPLPSQYFIGDAACVSPCSVVYAIAYAVTPYDGALLSIDLISGTTTVISGGHTAAGSGPTLYTPDGIALDSSTGTLRALVAESTHQAVLAVNLTTGARTVLSSAAVGSGPAFTFPKGLVVDAANNRALLVDNNTDNDDSSLVAIDLSSGNRSKLSSPSASHNFNHLVGPAFDTANQRVFVSPYAPSSVLQVSLATGAVERFADNAVGSGPVPRGDSLLFDPADGSLLTSGFGQVLRVNPRTGNRVSVGTVTLPGNGRAVIPRNFAFDTRPGIPDQRLFFTTTQNLGPMRLYSMDLPTGEQTLLSSVTHTPNTFVEYPFDAANARMIASFDPTLSTSRIAGVDVISGAFSTIADSNGGSPFDTIVATALDDRPGMAARLLGADITAKLFSFDLSSGVSTVVSSSSVGTGFSFGTPSDIAVDPVNRQALAVTPSQSLVLVDLQTGNRNMITFNGFGPSYLLGGPKLNGGPMRVAADFEQGLAWVTSNSDSIVLVDIPSGGRVITSR